MRRERTQVHKAHQGDYKGGFLSIRVNVWPPPGLKGVLGDWRSGIKGNSELLAGKVQEFITRNALCYCELIAWLVSGACMWMCVCACVFSFIALPARFLPFSLFYFPLFLLL